MWIYFSNLKINLWHSNFIIEFQTLIFWNSTTPYFQLYFFDIQKYSFEFKEYSLNFKLFQSFIFDIQNYSVR